MSLLDDLLMDEMPAVESYDEFDFDFDFEDEIAEEGIRDLAGAAAGKVKAGAGAAYGAAKSAGAGAIDAGKYGVGTAKNIAGAGVNKVKGIPGAVKAAPGAVKDKLAARKSVEAALLKAEKKLNNMAQMKDGLARIEKYEAAVKAESAKIRSAVNELIKLNKAVEDGKMAKKDAVRRAKPIVKEVGAICHYMKYGTVIKDKLGVTSEDLKTLSAYTKGLQGLIAKAKAEAKQPAAESFMDFDELLAACEAEGPEMDFFAFEEEEAETAEMFMATESFGADFDIDAFLDAEFAE